MWCLGVSCSRDALNKPQPTAVLEATAQPAQGQCAASGEEFALSVSCTPVHASLAQFSSQEAESF